jgi:homocysteine S-methyltransferase
MALSRLIEEQGYAVLDGGFSTCLEERGYPLDRLLWSGLAVVERPDIVESVHKSFLAHGADIITTSSYQISYEGFSTRGWGAEEVNDIIRCTTGVAVKARDDFRMGGRYPLVAASVGTFGAHLADGSEYVGLYGKSARDLCEWHRGKFEILSRSGCDIVACETVPCVDEAVALAELLSGLPAELARSSWLSMSCSSDSLLNSREPLEKALRRVEDPDAFTATSGHRFGIGINCTNPQYIAGLLEIIADNCSRSRTVVVYPNSGELYNEVDKVWRSRGTDFPSFSELVPVWYDLGARVIGGCCRTTPATVSDIRACLNKELRPELKTRYVHPPCCSHRGKEAT